jgi:2-amino-4-hydroxy-6-hydroxymethyldihydropteridine diphosphokinase
MSIHRCLIAFGANLGTREQTWEQARRELAGRGLTVVAASRLHVTMAAGGPAGQPDFINAALIAHTDLEPVAILQQLREVENGLGRTRAIRWAPRIVDLDLLLVDDIVSEGRGLVLPHPRMAWRKFVLEPAAEVAADWRHPVIGETLGELARRLRELPRLVVWLTRSPAAAGEVLKAIQRLKISLVPIEAAGHHCPVSLAGAADTGEWMVMVGDAAGALASAAEQARLLVWDRNEWEAGGHEAATIDRHRGAVMDLARGPDSICDDLAAAILAMS